MYAVVGCGECEALWIVEGSPETTQCPTCGHRRQHATRRKFFEAADEDAARDARTRLLAERQGAGEAVEDLDDFATMETSVAEAGPDDAEYLAGSGLDPDAVAEAGERASGADGGASSRTDVVHEAVRELDEATDEAVAEYAAERGVEPAAARETLAKLARAGELSESGGTYRVL